MPRIPLPILIAAAAMLVLALILALTRDPPDPRLAQPASAGSAGAGGAVLGPATVAGPATSPTGWVPIAGGGAWGGGAVGRWPVAGTAAGGFDPRGAGQVRFLTAAPTIQAGTPRPHEPRGECEGCHTITPAPAKPAAWPIDATTGASTRVAAPGCALAVGPEGSRSPQCAGATGLPATAAQPRADRPTVQAAKTTLDMLPFQEAHWQGLEVIATSPGLSRVLGIPRGARGVVIDEVTMPADVEGFAAGDLITAVGNLETPDLESFVAAADRVRDESKVLVKLLRKGEPQSVALAAGRLGTANGETAPMIPSGSRPPHGYQGPCTNCHRIGMGGSLAVDLGDVLSKTAPPILWGQKRPHQDRGICSACHTIR